MSEAYAEDGRGQARAVRCHPGARALGMPGVERLAAERERDRLIDSQLAKRRDEIGGAYRRARGRQRIQEEQAYG